VRRRSVSGCPPCRIRSYPGPRNSFAPARRLKRQRSTLRASLTLQAQLHQKPATSGSGVHHAPQNLPLPVGGVDRPALDGPVLDADDTRPAVLVDIALTLFLCRLQLAAHGPGVAAALVNVAVVQNGNDAWLRQVQQAQRDDLLRAGGIALP